ncbi:MAG: outer membrane beta-barrel protein [Bacteroidota bacterium]
MTPVPSSPSVLRIALLSLLFLLTTIGLRAQRGNYNYSFYELKKHYFGITLGYQSYGFQLHRSEDLILNPDIRTVESIRQPGFNLGFIHNYKLGRYLDFRTLFHFSFASRRLEYRSTSSEVPSLFDNQELISLSLPFQLRYKSAPYRDKRVFATAGIKYTHHLTNNSQLRNSADLINISPIDFSVEVGAGVQFFMPYFIFSPEIKFSQGVGNILLRNEQLNRSNVLESILSRALTISLHFEG